MEGRKFSSSRQVVIYVRDFLERYDADALRYYIAVAGPENQDTDFTWSEFLNRNNGELVAAWGNLVNRSISMAAKNFGAVPEAGELTDADRALLERSRAAFAPVGAELARSRFKNAVTEAFDVVRDANRYLAEQEPWKIKDDPARVGSILHVALQVVDDAKTLLTPFLPNSSNKIYSMLGGTGVWSGMPELQEVAEEGGEGGRSYPVISGSYEGRPAGSPSRSGRAPRSPRRPRCSASSTPRSSTRSSPAWASSPPEPYGRPDHPGPGGRAVRRRALTLPGGALSGRPPVVWR
nr:hypothetical protein GCM10020093_063230 [Planobispora longispora]